MSSPPRGARVIILPSPAHPELAEMVGKAGLVVEVSHADASDRAVVSFDGMPGVLGLVPHESLGPYEERPCLSLDPSCCSLRPCGACLSLLRDHLGASIQAATLTPEQARNFVQTWNRLRSQTQEQMVATIKQAREYAEKAALAVPVTVPVADHPSGDPNLKWNEPAPEAPATIPATKAARRAKKAATVEAPADDTKKEET